MPKPYPISLQTTYQDLLEAHLDRRVSELEGTPELRKVAGKTYWYSRFRIGSKVTGRYIGPDTPEVRARVERSAENRENRKAFDERCAIWVAQLRAAGLPTLDRDSGKVLKAMEKSGVFRLGGTLVGTHAFRLYTAELGTWLTDRPIGVTEDIDVAAFKRLSMAIDDTTDPKLPQALGILGLEPVPALDARDQSARWRMKGGGIAIDFLTASFSEDEGLARLKALGVTAQSLHYLDYLIKDPIPAVALYRSGVLVQIPSPERYAVHKLIVAQRRKGLGRSKAIKDLAQARVLIEALSDVRPGELALALKEARGRGPKWRDAIDASLEAQPAIADRLSRHE